MGSRVIMFFDRQEVLGDPASSAVFYSPVYDLRGAKKLIVEEQVFSSSHASAPYSATFVQTSDPTLGDSSWSNLAVSTVAPTGGTGRAKATITDPERFVRVKLTVPPGISGVYSSRGVARG